MGQSKCGDTVVAAFKSIAASVFLCLALSPSAFGQLKRPQSANGSCREFVAQFYSWYLVNAPKEWPAGDTALKNRSYLFSPAIVQAVREDEEAQAKAGSDLVSLDGDPFVGADGLAGSYIVETVTVRNGRCWAEVHGVWDGKEGKTPDVIPELAIKNGKWRFENFWFPTPSNPKGWDLLSQLQALRKTEKQDSSGKGQKQ